MQVVIPEVKELVVRGVEGLTVDKVAVSLFPARATGADADQAPTARFFGVIVANSSVTTLWAMVLVPWIMAAVLLMLLLNAVHLRKWLKRTLPFAVRSNKIEAMMRGKTHPGKDRS